MTYSVNDWQQDDYFVEAREKAPAMCLKATGRENAQRSQVEPRTCPESTSMIFANRTPVCS